MTKILGVGDLHLGPTHLADVPAQEEILRQIGDLALIEDAKLLLIAGDTFHRNRPGTAELVAAGRFFQRLEHNGVEVVVVPGNHDPEPPAILQHFPGIVRVADRPGVISTNAGIDVACMPYLPDRFVRARLAGNATREEIAHELTRAASELIQGMLAERAGRPLVFLGHGTISGSVTNTGYTMGLIGGTEWRLLLEDLVLFDLAIVGHIHKRQTPAPNVVVPGSPLALDFAEEGERSVVIADLTFAGGYVHACRDCRAANALNENKPLVGCRTHRGGALAPWRFAALESPGVETIEISDLSGIDSALVSTFPANLRVRYHADEELLKLWPVHRLEAELRARGPRLVQIDLEVVHVDRRRDEGMTDELDIARAMDRYLEAAVVPEPARGRLNARAAAQLAQPFAIGIGAAAAASLEVARLEAEDFLGLRSADVDLSAEVLALAGPVGIGKSSIGCDVLRFALFGASRYGARNTALLVREGARSAFAAVELAGAGERYRIVRKIAVDGRGRATTTLDVLQAEPREGLLNGEPMPYGVWRPLSDGKIASGEEAIGEILGGLTDAILTVANLVVQRDADGWTAGAKPEERKRLLAGAAGLAIYDELADDAARSARAGDRERDLAGAKLEPIRARLARIPELEDEVRAFTLQREGGRQALEAKEREARTIGENLERERSRAESYTEQMTNARNLQAAVTSIEEQIGGWDRRKSDAQGVLAGLPSVKRVKDDHRKATLLVAELETERDRAVDVELRRGRARERKAELETQLNTVRGARQSRASLIASALRGARDQARRLEASGCPVIDAIRSKELDACTFLSDAQREVATIADLEVRLAGEQESTPEEDRITAEILAIEIPPAVDRPGIARRHDAARVEMERLAELLEGSADRRSRSEQTIAEHATATADLAPRLAEAQKRATAAKKVLLGFAGSPPAAVESLARDQAAASQEVTAARDALQGTERRLAASEALLADCRAVESQAAEAEAAFQEAAAAAEEYGALTSAWKACRVLVLESSVIPAVERTANEILRRFPYGLQIALRTQREKLSGAGMSEALDVEVQGGKASLYEGCSGGQRTTIDVALHVAIALVVSRRAAARLRFLFLDEPEGLDAAGRVALAGIVRWISEAFALRVLVASHHEDLLESLGAELVPITGDAGAAIVGGMA